MPEGQLEFNFPHRLDMVRNRKVKRLHELVTTGKFPTVLLERLHLPIAGFWHRFHHYVGDER